MTIPRRIRLHLYSPAILALGLTLAAIVGLGAEVLRPGHHVHPGAGGQHHHHFFVGGHSHGHPHATHHGGPSAEDQHVGSEAPTEVEAASPAGPSQGQPAPPTEEGSSSQVIEGFVLQAPTVPSGLSTPRRVIAHRVIATGVSLQSDPALRPQGGRAPPTLSRL